MTLRKAYTSVLPLIFLTAAAVPAQPPAGAQPSKAPPAPPFTSSPPIEDRKLYYAFFDAQQAVFTANAAAKRKHIYSRTENLQNQKSDGANGILGLGGNPGLVEAERATMTNVKRLMLLGACGLGCYAQQARVGSGGVISGALTGDDGSAIAGGSVSLHLLPPYAGKVRATAWFARSGAGGAFAFDTPYYGQYRVCAQVANTVWLNPCEWGLQPPTAVLSPAKKSTSVAMVLKKGVAADPGGRSKSAFVPERGEDTGRPFVVRCDQRRHELSPRYCHLHGCERQERANCDSIQRVCQLAGKQHVLQTYRRIRATSDFDGNHQDSDCHCGRTATVGHPPHGRWCRNVSA